MAGESSAGDPAEYVRANATAGSLSTTLDIGTAGTNRLVTVYAMTEADAASALSSVTVDSKSCTLVQAAHNTEGLGNRTELWYADESDLGSSNGTVTITIAGTGLTASRWATHAQLFTGIVQSGPNDSGVDTTSVSLTTATVTNINVSAGGIVTMGGANGTQGRTATYTSPLTQTSIADPSSADGVTAEGIESSAQTNKSYVITWSGAAVNRSSAVAASWDSI
jgi:hypothetical protein